MPPAKRGPKPPPIDTALDFARTGNDVDDFERFCAEYIRLEHGVVMQIRPWQRDIVNMVWGENRPKLAALAIGRGNSKSTLAAAMCCYLLYGGDEVQIDLLARDERQAAIIGGICRKMVTRHRELDARASLYKDHISVGQSELCWLPANAAALEGRLPDFTICDEGGRIDKEVYEVASFSASKKAHAQLVMLGTPGPNPDNVLSQFREYCLSHPEDMTQRYMEFSAHQWTDHPVDCDDHDGGPGCLSAANPALDDWLSRESVLSTLPPKMSEQHWRRVRLVQHWATGAEDPFLSAETWDALATGEDIPPGTPVVVALDGSHSRDATALLLGTVSARPHFAPLQVWERPPGDDGWRVPVLEVEQAIRDACIRWDVKEVVADPFRWTRTLEVLKSESIPVMEFPHSPSRLTAATTDLHSSAVNQRMSHSGDETLRRHVLAAKLIESRQGGLKLGKASQRRSAEKIDLAACLVMAHSRATYLGTRPKRKRSRVIGV